MADWRSGKIEWCYWHANVRQLAWLKRHRGKSIGWTVKTIGQLEDLTSGDNTQNLIAGLLWEIVEQLQDLSSRLDKEDDLLQESRHRAWLIHWKDDFDKLAVKHEKQRQRILTFAPEAPFEKLDVKESARVFRQYGFPITERYHRYDRERMEMSEITSIDDFQSIKGYGPKRVAKLKQKMAVKD